MYLDFGEGQCLLYNKEEISGDPILANVIIICIRTVAGLSKSGKYRSQQEGGKGAQLPDGNRV